MGLRRKKKDFLIERFEELHQGLFDVTILYFTACTLLIARVSAQFREWDYERRHAYLEFKGARGAHGGGGALIGFRDQGTAGLLLYYLTSRIDAVGEASGRSAAERMGGVARSLSEAFASRDVRSPRAVRARARSLSLPPSLPLCLAVKEYEWKQQHHADVAAGRADGSERFELRGWSQAAQKMELGPGKRQAMLVKVGGAGAPRHCLVWSGVGAANLLQQK